MAKALFLDIDGTLVSFRTHRIPLSTLQALEQAKERGHRIFIATGRPKVLINNLGELQQRQLIDGYVTMNGAYCFVGNEVIYSCPIPRADVQALSAYCATHGHACIFVGEHDIHVCQPNQVVKDIFYDFLHVDAIPECSPEEAIYGRDIYQMTPFITQEQERGIVPQLTGCELGRWFPAFADLTARGNTKQSGIDHIVRRFGLRLEDTVAFGDGGNDIPMLGHAGIGVAMGNASDEVKAHADYVTTPVDEDGIRNALLRLGLI